MTTDVSPLRIESLSKDFRQGSQTHRVLYDISLEISKGEFAAVMGPSGSGKSTLLHVIAGLTDITGGKIYIQGEEISKMGDSRLSRIRRKKVGFVFQSFNLISSLTVDDNICLPVLADGEKPDREKLLRLAERLGISDKLSRYPGNLSGGEQQRVAIARALLPDPAIILADEPTGSLDTVSGQELCLLLRELCSQDGATILMVTHEPAVAIQAGKTLILKDGRLTGEIRHSSVMTANELASEYQNILSQNVSNAVK